MLRQQEMLIGTFTIDCHLVLSSMSLSPEAFLPVLPHSHSSHQDSSLSGIYRQPAQKTFFTAINMFLPSLWTQR